VLVNDARRPFAVVACRVLESIIRSRLEESDRPLRFLDYGLHRHPQLMAAAIQVELDALPEPHLVCIGYGLCGNGLVGVKAGRHTLLIPRTDDCIAMFLGSYEAYLEEFTSVPGTYYLTRGWLESGSDPLSEYRDCESRYGPEDASWIMDEQYRNYERLCLVGHSDEDLETCRPRALEVAEFCRGRWGWRYEERLGSDGLIRRLLEVCASGRLPDASSLLERDFVVVPPGGEVRQELFLRARDAG
jgi:hypothetical protein